MCMPLLRAASSSWAGWTFRTIRGSTGTPMPTCWPTLSPTRFWGAVRGGDIGKLFPDTDPAYKDADSLKLLAEVARFVRERGFEIIDVDSVIARPGPEALSLP